MTPSPDVVALIAFANEWLGWVLLVWLLAALFSGKQ
jgi:hypothetical protein